MDVLKDALSEIIYDAGIVGPGADISGLKLLSPGGVADSLTALRLIETTERRFGVDIMGDINLDCMETADTLLAFIRRNAKTAAHIGKHLIMDCSGCPERLLNDIETVKALIHKTAEAIGTRVLKEEYHAFTPAGVTGFAVVSASHIAAHTWPEYGYLALDVFSCRGFVPETAEAAVKSVFPSAECRSRVIERFIP